MKVHRIITAAALIVATSLPLHAAQSDEERLGDIKRKVAAHAVDVADD